MNAHGYPSELACRDIYSHALNDAGIAYVDTSDSYAPGVRIDTVIPVKHFAVWDRSTCLT